MIVRQKIKSHIDENSMTVRDLERKAGLKPSAVKNIINGSSKNPTIQIVHSIAKALGCTIDDLVENKASSKSSSESDWNCNLYIQVLTKSSKYLSKIGVTLSEKVFFILVDEIYDYTIRDKSKTVNNNFLSWRIDKYVNEAL